MKKLGSSLRTASAVKALLKQVFLLLLLIAPVLSLQAASINVNCKQKSLASEIANLDKSVPNTVNISNKCTEDIVVSGHKDLTLIGKGGASITATVFLPEDPYGSTIALLVEDSRVTVQTLTINGGYRGASCERRSTCVFRNVTIQGGHNGVVITYQSAADIVGSSVIQNSIGMGVGVFNESHVWIHPDAFDLGQAGPIIRGHTQTECDVPDHPDDCWDNGFGAVVFDGSFLRTDNVEISGNGTGIDAHRNSVIKIYVYNPEGVLGGVINNVQDGIRVRGSSTAGIGGPVWSNGGAGIFVGALSFFQDQGVIFSENNPDVFCDHLTAISQPDIWCGH